MIAHLPDRETIETALSLATRAPSMRENQPWLWRVGERSLHLYADGARSGLDGDAGERAVLLSCGAALNHCVVALAALGWRAEVRRFPDPAEPEHVAALELYPHSAGALCIVLAAAIPRRRSDWRPYSTWPVSAADLALIAARGANAGVTTRRVESLPAMQYAVAQAVWMHASEQDQAREPTVRNKRHAPLADVPRIYTSEVGPVARVAPPFADSSAGAPSRTESPDDNAAVFALGTKDDSPLARLRAGEATSLMLLSATALGLASCPVAEPLEIAETRDALQSSLFDVVGHPQMLMRIGWPLADADPLPAPPRRPLADVCEWVGRESLSSA
jgi:nitroreductase